MIPNPNLISRLTLDEAQARKCQLERNAEIARMTNGTRSRTPLRTLLAKMSGSLRPQLGRALPTARRAETTPRTECCPEG